MTVILFNLKGNIKMKKTVKNLCLFASCLTMFMAIHPGKAGADSCGSENDGYAGLPPVSSIFPAVPKEHMHLLKQDIIP